MNTFYKAFIDLVGKVKDDAHKVLDDSLDYIIARMSVNEKTGISWNYNQDQTRAFYDFMGAYCEFMEEKLKTQFWFDAWGDLFMENSGTFQSFRGQFFTPAAVSNLAAKIGFTDSERLASGRPVVNDCACGSARMLLAAQQCAYEKQQMQPYLVGEDIDGTCCKMAAVNLAIHGCFGEVIRHDSLKDPGEFLYGYIINESLASGLEYPSIRISREKCDFWKLRNTKSAEPEQLSLF